MERKPNSGAGSRGRYAAPARSGSAVRDTASRNRSGAAPSRSASGRDPHRLREPQSSNSYGRTENMRRPNAPVQHSNDVRRPAPRRTKRRRRSAGLVPFLVLIFVLALGIYVGSAYFTVAANRSTFCSNITVNGILLDDYTLEGGLQAVHDALDARIHTQFTLTSGGQSWSFSPADFGATIDADDYVMRAWNIGHVGGIFDCKRDIALLKNNPVEFNAELQYDAELIDAFLDPIYDALYVEPIDATVVVAADKPYLSGESSLGQELDREAAKALIEQLVEAGSGDTELPLLPIEPSISSDTAKGGFNVIVEYATDTSFRRSASRQNVAKALGYFDGFAVHPGDTVDFNAIVGPRTKERGWQLAPEYAGNTSQDGYGGGVCQASSTLYGAVLLAGMDIIERSNHSMTVSYVEPSLDAAVIDTGYKNFVFRNNTEHTIYIYTSVNKEYATVTIYGNRPAYRYQLYSEIVSQDSACQYTSYVPDTEGKHCYYTTETALHTQGHPACSSKGWLIAYDWDTGEEVSRKQLSYDVYESGTDIYWRGIHDPATGAVVTNNEND